MFKIKIKKNNEILANEVQFERKISKYMKGFCCTLKRRGKFLQHVHLHLRHILHQQFHRCGQPHYN